MKYLNNLIAAFVLIAAFALYSCSNDDEIPGSGEGKLGFAFVLNNSSSSSPNSRVQNSKLTIESGFIQIKELEFEVEGRNETGSFEREFEIRFNDIRKVTFDQFDESTDFFVNIEAGEYKEIELELDLIDHRNEPSIYIEGTYEFEDGSSLPVVFEHFGDDIDFEVEIEGEDDDAYFLIDSRNNPLALFEISAGNWFRGVSDSAFENAEVTDGVILISRTSNRNIYSRVKNNIEEFADIEIELKN
ncbi:hypothetical protein A33Q_0602 [Indibacter alkaliphilus LW1]|uniref:DUF4382 domain-containing protein n=1 Tax=Indibacter alkaliphilus (strain CCUG 57479 / KCTC 22604 / LW1) TaxID=1189612 RepID=S2DJG6_INDAL|nr:hypothetical protein [Indibacter alkaliphilus]EOZ99224.1 hypothetical protein A33Q_0602 [Indibacter alkaliphilus LW1]